MNGAHTSPRSSSTTTGSSITEPVSRRARTDPETVTSWVPRAVVIVFSRATAAL